MNSSAPIKSNESRRDFNCGSHTRSIIGRDQKSDPPLAATSRRSMGRVDLSSTTNRSPGARPAPTFSTVEEAHTGLIERLAVLKPNRILYIADAQDLEERAGHLQQVLGAVLDYVGAIVADTSHVAPGGSIDRKYLLSLISDLAGDVAGSIANAADDLAAGRV
jgi:hypothetical protein